MIFANFFSAVATSFGEEADGGQPQKVAANLSLGKEVAVGGGKQPMKSSSRAKAAARAAQARSQADAQAKAQQEEHARAAQEKTKSNGNSNNNNNTGLLVPWQLDRKYTMSEVQSHCSLDDCWMVIFDKVYNITEFVNEHPGGDFILLEYAGQDATHPFLSSRHGSSAYKMLDRYWIGILVDEELYYSNNSSYCSVYSSLSWRSKLELEQDREEDQHQDLHNHHHNRHQHNQRPDGHQQDCPLPLRGQDEPEDEDEDEDENGNGNGNEDETTVRQTTINDCNCNITLTASSPNGRDLR